MPAITDHRIVPHTGRVRYRTSTNVGHMGVTSSARGTINTIGVTGAAGSGGHSAKPHDAEETYPQPSRNSLQSGTKRS